MKRKKAALYDPYLDVLGGGEKHILSILQVLQQHNYDIEIFWDSNLTKELTNTLNLNFNPLPQFRKNIFKNTSVLDKLKTLANIDIFIYVTDGSYFFSSAKKNYIFAMVPQQQMYSMPLLNKLKTLNSKFIANSFYTSKLLSQWNINSEVIYPYLDNELISFDVNNLKKEKIILSVGRFFKHLHSKKQDIIIETFKTLKNKNPQFNEFKLILAGGLKKEDQDYFNELKQAALNDDSITLKSNISHQELTDLYKKSMIYWHFTGYGVDEKINPQSVEHLGITPLEAMAMGCAVFCYEAGGPKELIQDNINGFLFQSKEQLEEKLILYLSDINKQQLILTKAKTYVVNNFSFEKFKQRVEEVLLK